MNEYTNPMDRGYNAAHDRDDSHGHSHGGGGGGSFGIGKSTGDLGIGIGDLGFSFSLGPVPNVQAIAAKIRPGSKRIELAFTGTGKGTGQGQTPEYYGKKQRQALREVSQANRVDFSTHSTIGIAGLAGMDQQGSFSKASKNFSTQEVKRAIEFAGDVSGGGPVVVHTGEFQRPISDADWNQEDGEHKGKFKMFSDEEKRASFRVIDTRTGAVVQEARKNKKVARPVWNTVKDGGEYLDFDGTMKTASGTSDSSGKEIYLDYFGNRLQPEKRVPEYNDETGTFKVHYLEWDDLKKEAKEMTHRAKEVWRDWKSGKISKKEFDDSYWTRFKSVDNEKEIKVRPEEAFIISTLETNAANSRGWGYYYGAGFKDNVDNLKKLNKALKLWEKIEAETDEEEKWQLMKQTRQFSEFIPSDSEMPTKLIKDQIREFSGRLMQAQESAASQFAQAEEAKDQIRHIESADTYAFNEALDSYADLGISAMRQTEKTKKEGRYVKPIAIAMENLFPEQYGAHPEELIKLVKGSRRTMEKKLMQLGVSSEEATKKAKDHITSTFDTGHLNTWRKYWDADPKKTIEQNDKDFDKWSLDMVRKMVKEGVVGHVHLDDNYGYHDDHLAPGEGNTPIREMVKILKEEGYKGEMIVEPGADFTTDASGFHSVMKTWRHFGIPVYGSGAGSVPGSRTWNEVGYGWFGQQAPPYFTFGGYSPSEDWTLWSGVQLE